MEEGEPLCAKSGSMMEITFDPLDGREHKDVEGTTESPRNTMNVVNLGIDTGEKLSSHMEDVGEADSTVMPLEPVPMCPDMHEEVEDNLEKV